MNAGSVFIVDDNPSNLSLLAGILREAGYEVRLAQSARRALAALRGSDLPELILLDINMPEMDGISLCKLLKEDPSTAGVPVVFLSALDDVADKVSAFNAGGVDYVTKPFQREEVLARVATQLRLARLRRALEDKNEELRRKNEQLEQAWRERDVVFSALADVLPGTVLDGRFRLEEKIGSGGFSAIYRGRDLERELPVAVKVLRPDGNRDREGYLARFRNEGLSSTRLSHPNAISVLESGVTPAGVAYIVMELLRGRSLAEELAERPLSLARCVEILGPVCEVLDHAHAQGILHRDVKPANIFLHDAGDGREVVKVLDFGIAKLFDREQGHEPGHEPIDALTTIGRVVGTPVYMAPERLLGKAHDARSDSYSVGVMLYQMIAGRLPFDLGDRSLGSVIMACVSEPAAPLGQRVLDVPPAVEALVMRALSKSPDDRPTVAELARDLAAAVRLGAAPLDRPLALTVEIFRD